MCVEACFNKRWGNVVFGFDIVAVKLRELTNARDLWLRLDSFSSHFLLSLSLRLLGRPKWPMEVTSLIRSLLRLIESAS